MKQGVAQGRVLSPFLFNLFLRSLPSPPEDVKIITYADIPINTSGPDVKKLAVKVSDWLKSRKLVLSAGKSTATIFTTWSKEVGFESEVYINEEKIPVTKTLKVLVDVSGIVLTFTQHAEKVQNRNHVPKKLAGTSWGCTNETLSTSYKAIGRSVTNYAPPIWTPDLSQSNRNSLQAKQNAALRTVTGCV